MNKITYKVPGISCGHCVNTIEMEIGELEGVKTVKAEMETRTVTIEYQDPASEQLLLDTMSEINYPVQAN